MKNGIKSKFKDSIGQVVPELTREMEMTMAVALHRRIKVNALLEYSERIVKDTTIQIQLQLEKKPQSRRRLKTCLEILGKKLVKL